MIKEEPCKYKNTFTLGAALKLLNLSIDEGKKILSRQFAKKDFSEEIMNQNYQDLKLVTPMLKNTVNENLAQS